MNNNNNNNNNVYTFIIKLQNMSVKYFVIDTYYIVIKIIFVIVNICQKRYNSI